MTVRPDVLQAILLLGIASYACRFSGFFLMRYLSLTPRVEAWLRAIPISLIGAMLAPIAVNGGPPEWLGLVTAIGLMRISANEFVSSVGAVAVVAAMRSVMGA